MSLIENRKLFVNEVSLAEVTNDYIAFIKSINHDSEHAKIADVSAFIIVAATLILIKSKSLLPNLNLTEDEEEKIEDLEARLKLYSIIKNASIDVKENFGTQIIFSAPERNWSSPVWSPDEKVTITVMASAIADVINHIPKKVAPLPEIEIQKVINIEEIINSLTDRIQNSLNTSFRDFTRNHGGSDDREMKVTVIVSFLAMLELVREGIIDVIQNAGFEDIEMRKITEIDIKTP